MARDVYAEVTAKILSELEQGTVPWVKPWKSGGRGSNMPKNATTEKFYNGSNVVLLWMAAIDNGWPHRWLTFKQAKAVGGHVRAGEHGQMIVYADRFVVKDKETGEEKRIPFLKAFRVFNVTQVDELPEKIVHGEVPVPQTIEERNADAEAFVKATAADIRENSGEAMYIPSKDYINMPEFKRFTGVDHFYATEFHELGHWTGHEKRLNRNIKNQFGTVNYAAEELVAELTSAFLTAEFGFEGNLRHADYIANWIQLLKDDSKAFIRAAAAAQKAADHLRGLALAEEPVEQAA